MSREHPFKVAHDAILNEAKAKVDAIRNAVDQDLEKLAIEHFGPVDQSKDHGFNPPPESRLVTCMHCEDEYQSSEMQLAYRPHMQAIWVEGMGYGNGPLAPLWWCKHSDCDGAGYGHDIHPVKAKRKRRMGA